MGDSAIIMIVYLCSFMTCMRESLIEIGATESELRLEKRRFKAYVKSKGLDKPAHLIRAFGLRTHKAEAKGNP